MENNKLEKSDIILNPDGTANFDLNADGEVLGTCRGLFTFKTFLTPLEQLGASKDYRNLIGPNPELSTDQDRFLAFCLAQLRYRVIKAPPFWKTGEAFDGNVDKNIISIILDRAIEAESLYKAHLKEKRDKALENVQQVLKANKERLNPSKKEEG